MHVPAGTQFTATLISPGGVQDLIDSGRRFGARIEIPVTRAIVGYWRPATLSGYVWSVELEAPPLAPLTPGSGDVEEELRAALAAGEFELVWMDDGPVAQLEVFVPLHTYTGRGIGAGGAPGEWPTVDRDAVRPTVEDVAALERTRTYEAGDPERPTFTEDTRPTWAEVDALIDRAVPAVLVQLQPTLPELLYEDVRHAIALYVAVLVEGSHFREQLSESQVALYRDLFGLAVGGITRQVDQALEESGAGALRLA